MPFSCIFGVMSDSKPKGRGRPRKGPNSISFELNAVQAGLIQILVGKGTYGDAAADVVKNLMNEQLKHLQGQNVIPTTLQSAEIHSISSLEETSKDTKKTERTRQG